MNELGGLNLYNLVANDPIDRFDSDGRRYLPWPGVSLPRQLWRAVIALVLIPRHWDVAALLLEHSLQDAPTDPLILSRLHFAAARVRRTRAFRGKIDAIVRNAPGGLTRYQNQADSNGILFQRSDSGDLFAAIHAANFEYSGDVCKDKSNFIYLFLDTKIKDKYDFRMDWNYYQPINIEAILATIANNMAWSDQFFEVIVPYNLEINLREIRFGQE